MNSNSSFRAIPLCDWHCLQIKAYLLDGPSPTRYSTTRSIYPRSRGRTGRGRGGPGIPIDKSYSYHWPGLYIKFQTLTVIF